MRALAVFAAAATVIAAIIYANWPLVTFRAAEPAILISVEDMSGRLRSGDEIEARFRRAGIPAFVRVEGENAEILRIICVWFNAKYVEKMRTETQMINQIIREEAKPRSFKRLVLTDGFEGTAFEVY